MTMLMNDWGEGYVETEGVLLSQYQENHPIGNAIFVKDQQTKSFWSSTLKPASKMPSQSQVIFSPAFCAFEREDEQIRTMTKCVVSSEDRVVMQEVQVMNQRKTKDLEILSHFEQFHLHYTSLLNAD